MSENSIVVNGRTFFVKKAVFGEISTHDLEIIYNKKYMSYFDGGEFNFMSYDLVDESDFVMIKKTDVINVVTGYESIYNKFLIEKLTDNSNKASMTAPKNIKIKQKTYLMKDNNGFIKIGKSKNPKLRESTLQSENPSITLMAVCDDDIEDMLHCNYYEYRKRGEWFAFSDSQIKEIIKKYKFRILEASEIKI
jgi:hypothetical protein